MEFKTSKQWKHQIGLTDDGFYFDSNYYQYRDESSRTGYRIERIDNTRGEYDDKVWQNQEEKRKVQSMVGRYKKQAMKHLDSVCVGNF
tara:strand:- start:572 stop:835 length:264 start_codon:yes stop_codon:yes gene_type:complete